MTSPPVPSPEVPETPAEPAEPAKTERCLNCGAALDGRFCAACGQEARDPRPTTRELLHDVAGELFNWDGKLLGTLRVLVTRPGFLTTEVLAGRRRVAADTTSPSVAIRLSARAACRAQAGSDSYMPEVSSYYPKVGFVLLPIYALILSLVYRHRRYPEHLYFALHVHAFAFLMLALARLLAASPVRVIASWSALIGLQVILVYAALAQQRVYGGNSLLTVGKTAIIVVIYAFAFLIAVTAAALIALLN